MQKLFPLVAILFFFLFSASPIHADPTLTISRGDRDTSLSFSVSPTEGAEAPCTYELYGTSRRKRLKRESLEEQDQLHRWNTYTNGPTGNVTFYASELKKLRRKGQQRPKLFFLVQERCSTEITRSRLKKLRLRSTARKKKSLATKRYLANLAEQLPYSDLILEEAFPSLSFTQPIDIRNAGDGTDRLFIVEKAGLIKVFENSDSTTSPETFLDLTEKVSTVAEQGALSIAFHPNFSENRFFFVHYTDTNGDTVISRFTAEEDQPNTADPSSEKIILTIPQPSTVHNGGPIAFGPDGYLYIALGDGGTQLDPEGNGQDRTTLLGAVLRIDIDVDDPGTYSIPTDNPFVGNSEGYQEEIFAYGLRNPWRASFDSATGALWVGDVGQSSYEEVNRITSGANYGWVTMEGESCVVEGCDTAGLTLPQYTYGRELGSSVTGGYVYRGTSIVSLFGKYIFGDFVTGRVFALESESAAPSLTTLIDTDELIPTFGIDESGELYFSSYSSGKIYRIQAR
jgi:glucose/arabinose dehydrogenase